MTEVPNVAEALEQVRAFVDNLPAEGDAISGYLRGGVRYELTGAALQTLLNELDNQQLREQIAEQLERQAYKEAMRDVNGTECTEAKVLFAAARMVRGGDE